VDGNKNKNVERTLKDLSKRMRRAARKDRSHDILIWLFGLLAILILCLGPCVEKVYGFEPKNKSLSSLLAQTCVAEIGFQGTIAECELMWSINQRNAIKKNRSLTRQTRLFNSYWKAPWQRKRRPWIKHLEGIEAPKRWPSSMKWEKFADSWIDIEKAAEVFVNSHRQFFHDCQTAIDYGAPGETPRMQPYLKRLKCLGGKTRQRYWAFK
jgi:hypothetical protein